MDKRKDIGVFRDVATIRRLTIADGAVEKEELRSIYCRADRIGHSAVYCQNGKAGEGWLIVTRETDLAMDDVILCGANKFVPTAIRKDGCGYLYIDAAKIREAKCHRLTREGVGREFPAALTEKYIRYESPVPMDTNTTLWVLCVPKGIPMRAGDLIDVDGTHFHAVAVHTLGETWNEVEVVRKGDL